MSDLHITKVGKKVHVTGDYKSSHCSAAGKNEVDNKTDDQNNQEEESGLINDVANLAQKGISLITSPFSGITGGLSVIAGSLVSAFSPFLSFIGPGGDKKTVKDLTQTLLESRTRFENDKSLKVSKHTREAINRLYETVSKIAQREDLQEVDISELIRRWKDDPNSKILFELIQRLERGECAPFKDKEYRRALIKSLGVLEEGLRRVENSPRSPHTEVTRQEIVQAADPAVDTVRLHEERGGDVNFSPHDRRQVAENFSSMQHHIENILSSPAMSTCLGDFCNKLYSLVSLVKDFLWSWCFTCNEDEETKRQAEKICQERQAVIKKIDEICRRHKIKKKKAEELYSMVKRAKERLMNFLSIKNTEELKSDVKTRKYYFAKSQASENSNDLEYAKSKYRCLSAGVDYYKNLEEQSENSLAPSYFCESYLIDLELDVHC